MIRVVVVVGMFDEKKVVLELLLFIRWVGVDVIFIYFVI